MTVTMRDVAKLAGVSQSTVSRVLSGVPTIIPVSEDARQRVQAAVRELGYQPNLHAGSLRSQKTQMIAVMIADLANPFYHPLVRAIQDVADQLAYDVMVANTDHKPEKEKHFVASVVRRPMDGVIIVPSHLKNSDIDEIVNRTGGVVAAVGQHVTHPGIDVAFGDDEKASEKLVTWLHQVKGHKRIAFVGVPDTFPSGVRRCRAYERAMRATHLRVPAAYKQQGDWMPESGYAAMCRLLALPDPPTAVVVANDLMALGAMEAAFQAGLSVPRDVAIVGFDDIPAASWVRPRLTTVAQQPSEMGRLLAAALFERIQGKYAGPGRRIEVSCEFVERESA
jgi:DNA-binding LacI/PurR family transcriptional regulator